MINLGTFVGWDSDRPNTMLFGNGETCSGHGCVGGRRGNRFGASLWLLLCACVGKYKEKKKPVGKSVDLFWRLLLMCSHSTPGQERSTCDSCAAKRMLWSVCPSRRRVTTSCKRPPSLRATLLILNLTPFGSSPLHIVKCMHQPTLLVCVACTCSTAHASQIFAGVRSWAVVLQFALHSLCVLCAVYRACGHACVTCGDVRIT